MASDIWIDLPLSSLGFLNHFGYVYTTFDMNHAHGMLPDTAASQEAHKQFVWANQVVRPRLWDDTCWDVLQDHLGPVSEWMAVCLSVGTVELCHDWLQRGSPGCAGSSDVQWQQPGSPKSPEYLKHPCTTLYRCWLLNSEVLELCCYNFILIYRIQWHSWWYSHQRVTPD